MLVVIFRSRLRAEHAAEYAAAEQRVEALARDMPGFMGIKSFVAEDGERLSLHHWDTAEHLKAWREHPQHRLVQAQGRERFYSTYTVQVCENPRTSTFPSSTASGD